MQVKFKSPYTYDKKTEHIFKLKLYIYTVYTYDKAKRLHSSSFFAVFMISSHARSSASSCVDFLLSDLFLEGVRLSGSTVGGEECSGPSFSSGIEIIELKEKIADYL